MEFKHVSDLDSDALFARGFDYFEAFSQFIDGERIDQIDPSVIAVALGAGAPARKSI